MEVWELLPRVLPWMRGQLRKHILRRLCVENGSRGDVADEEMQPLLEVVTYDGHGELGLVDCVGMF